MCAQKRRTTKRRKDDVSIVGDLFRILFAVSMLVVAVMVAFFVFKNVNGGIDFSGLTTAAPTETEPPITIQSETKGVSQTKAQPSAATTEEVVSEPEMSSELLEDGDEALEDELKRAEDEYDYDESDYTDEAEKPISDESEKGPGVSERDEPVTSSASAKPTEKSTEKPKQTETAPKPKETAKPDAEIVDGPDAPTRPVETVEGGSDGPV